MRLLAIGLPALALALSMILPADAHGGGKQQLARTAVGPFLVYVWTSPDPWRVGDAHTTVAVTRLLDDGQETPATGVEVHVTYARAGQSERVSAVEQMGAQAGFYEADGAIATAGEWQVTIEVAGPEGGGKVAFVETVQAANTFNWWLIGGGVLAALLALGYFGTRKTGSKSNSIRKSDGRPGAPPVQRGAGS